MCSRECVCAGFIPFRFLLSRPNSFLLQEEGKTSICASYQYVSAAALFASNRGGPPVNGPSEPDQPQTLYLCPSLPAI